MPFKICLQDRGGTRRTDLFEADYTENVAPMFRMAIGATPYEWDMKPAPAVAALCCDILDAFDSDPDTFKELTPANGWGDFDGARAFIESVRAACEQHGTMIIRTR